jgi:maltooligosyltrehalose trehalohydrolase
MGEEYAEDAPFLYFVNHSDPNLIKAVREGRKKEFESFNWKGEVPDPQDENTFIKSKISLGKRNNDENRKIYGFYRELIALKKTLPALASKDKSSLSVSRCADKALSVLRTANTQKALCLMNFEADRLSVMPDVPEGDWRKILDSSEERWGGPGPGLPATLKQAEKLTLPGHNFSVYFTEVK